MLVAKQYILMNPNLHIQKNNNKIQDACIRNNRHER